MVAGAKRLDQSRQITIDVANMRMAMRGVSLFSIQNHPEQVRKGRAVFDASVADLRSVMQGMEGAELSPQERAAVNEIRSGVDKWLAGFVQFADLSAAGHGDIASEIALKTLTPVMDAIQKRPPS